ncbi:hypothetical protein EDD16DRAFT_1684314 [Pisolithus croceorrhizus]|nr:hypothetical protein EDD16DRAFT_1684314 [Pisolithus croceorrhizus]KAI6129108.1 hypothetical protein EV401DRAFT_1929474 [Pisolithus croceorrhizus]KAI6164258.1 hypothetical protein EDD17DRAFT_1563233 [Pisolithus thermaeus]
MVVSTLSRSISSIRSRVELWISRSFPSLFDVRIDLADREALLPIVSCFLPRTAGETAT